MFMQISEMLVISVLNEQLSKLLMLSHFYISKGLPYLSSWATLDQRGHEILRYLYNIHDIHLF